MKVITIIDQGVRRNISPLHVKEITVVKNDYNDNWCVNVVLTESAGGNIYPTLCPTKALAEDLEKEYLSCLKTNL